MSDLAVHRQCASMGKIEALMRIFGRMNNSFIKHFDKDMIVLFKIKENENDFSILH